MSNENNKWSEDEIMEMVKEKAVSDVSKRVVHTDTIGMNKKRRRFLVVACGDGGSMVAQEIKRQIQDTLVIAYNTSKESLDKTIADVKISPKSTDGSGKVRTYSKQIFKDSVYQALLGNVTSIVNQNPDTFDYILVVTTTDGGTGSGMSPMAAKLIASNVKKIPVVVIGVYPPLADDAVAQYNTLSWQEEVEKIDLPYMIFDNDIPGKSKKVIHETINRQVASMLQVLTGDYYGTSNISMIDSRDIYMMIQNAGGRIVIATDTKRPGTTQSMDEYVLNMLENNNQPEPSDMTSIGVFMKGPADIISKMDTQLPEVRHRYGDAKMMFSHVEESDTIRISVVMSGCSDPEDRLRLIRSRYDDVMNASKQKSSSLSGLIDGLANPIDLGFDTPDDNAESEPDISALDL